MKLFFFILLLISPGLMAQNFKDIALQSAITQVQPMTGIVLWNDHNKANSDAISLEYSYMLYNSVVKQKGVYNWKPVDDLLDNIASHKHQAVLRFRFIYPGYETSVPDYIKDLSDYSEVVGSSEGETTSFCDWSHQELKDFTIEFYTKFAERYDNDPRLAFIQTGFGLWAEYHIYDPSLILGVNFPDKAFQTKFLSHLDTCFKQTPWSISIDANETWAPFRKNTSLNALGFGLFDDSFMQKQHATENETWWNFFGTDRYKTQPAGGEFNYYTTFDQKNVLTPETGAHGISWETSAEKFHITYMIGNDQPQYQTMARVKEASMATGYKFKITEFQASATSSKVTVENIGIAPIYYHAYPTINGQRATESLKHLTPGKSRVFEIPAGGDNPVLTIECDRLVSGQTIEYEADLDGSGSTPLHSKTVIGYYANWQYYDRNNAVKPSNLDYSRYTILNYSFFIPDAQGTLESIDTYADEILLQGEVDWSTTPTSYKPNTSLIDLAHANGVEVMVSLGGWSGSENFPAIAADVAKRAHFASECIRLIETYQFDGIDIDWEYPGYSAHGGTPADKQNFTLLLSEIRDSLDSYEALNGVDLKLTAAFGATATTADDIDWEKVAPLLDYINLMTYDFFGSGSSISAHNSPQAPPTQGDDACIQNTVTMLSETYGVQKNKLNAGIAFYGKAVTNCTGLYQSHSGMYDTGTFGADEGVPMYYNIVAQMNLFDRYWDADALSPYLLGKNISTYVSYDDEQSIGETAKYVIDSSLAGVIIWEISGDYMDNGDGTYRTPLADTIVNTFVSYKGNGTIPETPEDLTNLTAVAQNCSTIVLSWTDTGGEEGYRIRRREIPAETKYTNLVDVAYDTESYTDETAEQGKTYRYMVRPMVGGVAVKTSNTPEAIVPVCPPAEITQTIELQAGWNMVSVYVLADNMATGTLFANASFVKKAGSFYAADGASNIPGLTRNRPAYLNSLTEIETGEGYLLYNTVTEPVEVTGAWTNSANEISVLSPVGLRSGWNLVGVSEDVDVSNLPVDVEMIKDQNDFYINGNNQSTLETLERGKAYWMYK